MERNYWLFVTNIDNWNIIKNKCVYGFNERSKKDISKIKNDDIVVIYVIPKKIGGIFITKSEKIIENIKFNGRNFPYKIKLEKQIIPEKFIEINNEIIKNISIFKHAMSWGTVLMGRSVKKITESDYLYIKSLM